MALTTVDVEILDDSVGSKGEMACHLLTGVMCHKIIDDVTSASLGIMNRGSRGNAAINHLFKTLWKENLEKIGSLASTASSNRAHAAATGFTARSKEEVDRTDLRSVTMKEYVPQLTVIPNSGVSWIRRPAPVMARPILPNPDPPRVVLSSKGMSKRDKFDGIEEYYVLQQQNRNSSVGSRSAAPDDILANNKEDGEISLYTQNEGMARQDQPGSCDAAFESEEKVAVDDDQAQIEQSLGANDDDERSNADYIYLATPRNAGAGVGAGVLLPTFIAYGFRVIVREGMIRAGTAITTTTATISDHSIEQREASSDDSIKHRTICSSQNQSQNRSKQRWRQGRVCQIHQLPGQSRTECVGIRVRFSDGSERDLAWPHPDVQLYNPVMLEEGRGGERGGGGSGNNEVPAEEETMHHYDGDDDTGTGAISQYDHDHRESSSTTAATAAAGRDIALHTVEVDDNNVHTHINSGTYANNGATDDNSSSSLYGHDNGGVIDDGGGVIDDGGIIDDGGGVIDDDEIGYHIDQLIGLGDLAGIDLSLNLGLEEEEREAEEDIIIGVEGNQADGAPVVGDRDTEGNLLSNMNSSRSATKEQSQSRAIAVALSMGLDPTTATAALASFQEEDISDYDAYAGIDAVDFDDVDVEDEGVEAERILNGGSSSSSSSSSSTKGASAGTLSLQQSEEDEEGRRRRPTPTSINTNITKTKRSSLHDREAQAALLQWLQGDAEQYFRSLASGRMQLVLGSDLLDAKSQKDLIPAASISGKTTRDDGNDDGGYHRNDKRTGDDGNDDGGYPRNELLPSEDPSVLIPDPEITLFGRLRRAKRGPTQWSFYLQDVYMHFHPCSQTLVPPSECTAATATSASFSASFSASSSAASSSSASSSSAASSSSSASSLAASSLAASSSASSLAASSSASSSSSLPSSSSTITNSSGGTEPCNADDVSGTSSTAAVSASSATASTTCVNNNNNNNNDNNNNNNNNNDNNNDNNNNESSPAASSASGSNEARAAVDTDNEDTSGYTQRTTTTTATAATPSTICAAAASNDVPPSTSSQPTPTTSSTSTTNTNTTTATTSSSLIGLRKDLALRRCLVRLDPAANIVQPSYVRPTAQAAWQHITTTANTSNSKNHRKKIGAISAAQRPGGVQSGSVNVNTGTVATTVATTIGTTTGTTGAISNDKIGMNPTNQQQCSDDRITATVTVRDDGNIGGNPIIKRKAEVEEEAMTNTTTMIPDPEPKTHISFAVKGPKLGKRYKYARQAEII